MKPQTIRLHIQAKHLIGTNFGDCSNCAVSKAFKEYLTLSDIPFTRVSESGNTISYRHNKVWHPYKHDWYEPEHFESDQKKAENALHPETIIRTLTLTLA